ncbi:glycosyl hydrolase family 28-related protein [Micromonospora sp. CA-248212]|uniref:glycosyl hydrolase family 28-related protein n=1 Tax=Micromonospora sp. CA-248212 TaxID=3239961 RepID=UPI003D8F5295
MPYRYSDPNTRAVWDQATGRFQASGRIARFWYDADGTDPVQLGDYLPDTPDVPGPPLGTNTLTVQADSMWPAVWDLGVGNDWVYVQVGTNANPGGLYRVFCDADQRLDVQAQRVADVESALGGKASKGDYWVNVKDYGAVGNGIVDDTLAIRAAIAELKAPQGNQVGGGTIYFPAGTYLCNQVDVNGAVLTVSNRINVTLRGGGNGSRIRTSTATATELLRMESCNLGSIQDLSFQVIGTARIQHAVHVTTIGDVGSVHGFLFDHLNVSCNGSYRRAFDLACTAGSTTLYSAQAAFAAGDVGGSIVLNLPEPLVTAIQSVGIISGTLAADVTTTTANTITLSAPLSGTPSSGFTIRVGTERMYVSAGGTTTTLTVSRGRGPDLTATTHTAGDAVVTYTATIADPVPTAFTNAALAGRIQPASAARMLNGISIATDHPGSPDLDVAQSTVSACVVSRAARAGVAVGNSVSADILDHWAYGLSVYESFAGVYADGGFLAMHGGDFSTNVVDYKRYRVVSQEAKITGIRSENPGMFYDFQVGGTAGPSTTISDVQVRTFNAEDGVVMRHVHSSPLTLMGIDLNSSNTARGNVYISVTGAGAGTPCHLVAINVAYNGSNNDIFSVGPPFCLRTIISLPRIASTSGNSFNPNTVTGVYTDLRLQAAGGFARSRRAVADTPTTVTTADSVVAYTSLTAARVVTLPAQGPSLPAGQEFTVKDETGLCDGTRTITVTPTAGTIDGAASIVLNTAYARAAVYTNGTNWFTR